MSGAGRLPSIRNLVHGSDSDSSLGTNEGRGQAGPSVTPGHGSHRHASRALLSSIQHAGSSSTSNQQREEENRLARINIPTADRPSQTKKLPSINEVLASTSLGPPPQIQPSVPDTTHMENQPKRHVTTSGYPCERCGRLFSRKADAVKHIRVVHDRVKNFACSACGRRFGRKDYCTKHEKSLHNIEPPGSSSQSRRKRGGSGGDSES